MFEVHCRRTQDAIRTTDLDSYVAPTGSTNGKGLPFRVADPRELLKGLLAILESCGKPYTVEETVLLVLAETDKWEAFVKPVQADATGTFLLPSA